MNRLLLSPLAVSDLQEIWLYIAQDSMEAADRVLEEFSQAFERLLDSPLMGRPREEMAPRLRSVVSGLMSFSTFRPMARSKSRGCCMAPATWRAPGIDVDLPGVGEAIGIKAATEIKEKAAKC